MGIILGTAGHVDHGKTTLIKALTGTNTDRLKEEKSRGITIDLGFAKLPNPNGDTIGIIDVPGHEKFIKNMLAGAGNVDIALFVIAADEGIMPQTLEHLDILKMLNIPKGIIALTKADLVAPDWLEMVTLEVEETMAGSFLENAPILPVSASTGQGIEDLKAHIFAQAAQVPPPTTHGHFRLPVDRVFTVDGFGAVVTGTLIEGHIATGDEVTLYPAEKKLKIRHIQVFGEDSPTAGPGQRVAVNLAPVKTNEIARGDVIATGLETTTTLQVKINLLPSTTREIQNNSRVHFYHGTKDLLCRVSLLGKTAIKPGESAYAQLYLTEALAVKNGDPFVIRFYSPLETIGGGVILDPLPVKTKNTPEALARLTTKDTGTMAEKIAAFVAERPFVALAHIKARFFNNSPDFLLPQEDCVLEVAGQLVHRDYIKAQGQALQALLEKYHQAEPMHSGMPISQLRTQGFSDSILDICVAQGYIKKTGENIAHKSFNFKINATQQKIYQGLLDTLAEGGFAPPDLADIKDMYKKDATVFKQVLDSAIKNGDVVLLTPQIAMHKDCVATAVEKLVEFVTQAGQITLAEFRDLLGVSRKYALALLDYFDRKNISKKVGDVRVLGTKGIL